MPGVSCEQKFRRLRLRVEPEGFLASSVQEELNGLSKIGETFILGFPLSIGPGHFQTSRPKTALVRLALMNDRRELFHAHIVTSFRDDFKLLPLVDFCLSMNEPDVA
jgi:hypothetical protein